MGTLSDRRFKGGGPRPRSNGSDGGPLRKIVGRCRVGYAMMEALECGHLQRPKCDLMGETNAARRRCVFCKRAAPPVFVGDPPGEVTPEKYMKQFERD